MKLIEQICKRTVSVKNILLALVAFVLISSVSALMLGFVIRREITVVDNGQEIYVSTAKTTVGEMLEEQGITLNEGDKISILPVAPLRGKDRIEIERAKRLYVTVDGMTQVLYSCESVLKDALAEGGIVLNEYDEIEPALETTVSNNLNVRIYRVEVFEETKSYKVPKGEVVRSNSEKPVGHTEIIEEGWDGANSITYRVVARDGQEVERTVISDTVLWEHCDKIIEKGTKPKATEKIGTKEKGDLSSARVLQCTATAYDASPESNGIYAGQTATGMKPAYGVVAVDPRVIPLGTKLYIEAVDGSWVYGYAIAGDTGGAIKGNKIDLFYHTAAECRQFGRRQAKVYILG